MNLYKVQAELFVMAEACRLSNSLALGVQVKQAQEPVAAMLGELKPEPVEYGPGVVASHSRKTS